MATAEKYVAFDLGAESGRVMLGSLADGHLRLEEIHRFTNNPVTVLDSLHWNVLHIWEEIKHGLGIVAARHCRDLAGIGLDTWGVDFALLDRYGALLGLPYHYRDSRTEGITGDIIHHISEWELYTRTGISLLPITTLCQLLAMSRRGSPALDAADALLMMPDLFNFWLCGEQFTESTIAGTSQLHDLAAHDWCYPVMKKLGIPSGLLREIVPPATVLGPLLSSVGKEVGLGRVPVIATACHDTAAASAVVPSKEGHPTFISSGTWSVMGRELCEPIITEDAMAKQFLNEIGISRKTMFAYNSTGLWPVQECRRERLREGHDWSYADLTQMAEKAHPFTTILNPDDEVFLRPGGMNSKMAGFCQRTGQNIPPGPGSVVRSFLEGLALRSRNTVEELERFTGQPIETICILGGGSKNRLLCQFTADATNRPVLAGPAEATASGTVLLQALALGSLSSIDEVREVIRKSCDLIEHDPRPSPAWDEAYGTFLRLSRQG